MRIAPFRGLLLFVIAFAAVSGTGRAQNPGPNVNIISPAPGSFVGDIFQRQVETDIAASPVNSGRAMAGFIDYQTISTSPPASAWCGYSETNNGGKTWKSNLVPGFPQDPTSQGASSPLRALGLQQCSDPVLAAAPPNGTDPAQIYYGALGLTQGGLTAAFVVTFQDPDDGSGHFNYMRTVVTDSGNPSFNGQVMDKPSITYDPPSSGFPQGIVHFAWVDFTGTAKNTKFQSKVMYSRSTDGGRTFSNPVKLNGNFGQNQGTAMARTANGTIYVVWRTFNTESGMQIVAISRAGSISTPTTIAGGTNFFPYDQPTLPDAGSPNYAAFRANAFPTIAADRNGRLLVAWQEYVNSSGLPASPGTGSAPLAIPKIVLTSSTDGITWSPRGAAVVSPPNAVQVEPVLKAGGGLVSLFYFDSTNDSHSQVLNFVPEFQQWIYTGSGVGGDAGIDRRMEVWIAQASLTPDGSAYTSQDSNGTPILGTPMQVSQYLKSTGVDSSGNPLSGVTPGQIMPRTPGFPDLAINLPNVKTTSDGSVPFIGDYIGMAPAVEFLPSNGAWRLALEPGDSAARTFYTVWTDTRSVQFPGFNINGNWGPYNPAGCVNPGTRNAKVFFSAISPGLIARWSGTSRPLQANGTAVPPQFAVTAENTSGLDKFFLVSITDNAPAEDWSLEQVPAPPALDPGDLNQGFGQILQSASLTFGVFYRPSSTNTTPKLPVVITIQEAMVDGSGNPILDSSGNPTVVPGGLTTSVTFTPSSTPISLGSTGLQVLTVAPQSPPKHIAGTGNAGSAQPSDISVQNFGFKNFGFKNFPPDQDVTWSISNQGLLPTSGNAFINASGVQTLLGSGTYEFNLFVYLTQSSPIYAGCTATQLLQDQVLSNIPITSTSNQQLATDFGFKNFGFKNFGFKNFGFKNFAPSDISNATFVAGQDGVNLTLRSTTNTPGQFNPTPSNGVLSEAGVAQSVNPLATDPSAAFDDVTPPVITVAVTNAVTGLPATLGPLGWYGYPVAATWTVVDPGSAVAFNSGCDTVTINSGVQTLTCTATNGAGLTAPPVSITIKVDTTAPVITPVIAGTPGNSGWYVSDVNVSWSVIDTESGISSSTGCATTTLTTDTKGTTFTCSATNGAGLSNSNSVTIKRDTTRPLITLTTPVNNANYLLNANVAANFGCTDATSGVATCTATLNGTPLTSGAKLNTSTVASNLWTFTVTAVDVAGNTAIQTNTYFVIYNFLLSPPKSPANLGSAVPLNWQLRDANGAVISDLTSLTTLRSVFNGQPVNKSCLPSSSGTALTTLYNPATGATGGSNFRLVSGGYQFNWDTTTANSTGKGCYTVIFQLKDDAGPAPGYTVLDAGRLHLTSVQLQ